MKTLIQMHVLWAEMGASAALIHHFVALQFSVSCRGPGASASVHENSQERDISPLSHTLIFYTVSFPGVSDTLNL